MARPNTRPRAHLSAGRFVAAPRRPKSATELQYRAVIVHDRNAAEQCPEPESGAAMAEQPNTRVWRIVLVALTLWAFVTTLAGISLFASSNTRPLRIGADQLNSEPYEMAAGIAHVVQTHHPDIKLETVATGGSADNIQMLADGTIDLALVQADTVSRENVSLIAVLYPDMFQLLVRPQSGIKDISDLEGKSIALPPITSGQYSAFWFLANQYGLAPEGFNAIPMTAQRAERAIRRGSVDAIFRVRGPRNTRIRLLISQSRLNLIPIDQGEAMHLRQPAFRATTIPLGSYSGERPVPPIDLPTVAVDRLLVARNDVDDDTIRAITSVLFEQRRILLLRTPLAAFIRQPEVSAGTLLPIHEGARAYYDRDQPGFLEEKAEFFAFILSFIVVLGSILLAVKRQLEERKKGRIDQYAVRLMDLEKEARNANTIPDLNTYKEGLIEILSEVVEDMNKGRVSASGLQFFAFTWESVNYTINDHEEQLRLGPETRTNGPRRRRGSSVAKAAAQRRQSVPPPELSKGEPHIGGE